jgi:hypothetical protein
VRSESAKLGDTLEPDPKLAEEIKRDSAAILCPTNSRLGRNFSAWFGILVRAASRSFSRRRVSSCSRRSTNQLPIIGGITCVHWQAWAVSDMESVEARLSRLRAVTGALRF